MINFRNLMMKNLQYFFEVIIYKYDYVINLAYYSLTFNYFKAFKVFYFLLSLDTYELNYQLLNFAFIKSLIYYEI
jgi:hypothetical protein